MPFFYGREDFQINGGFNRIGALNGKSRVKKQLRRWRGRVCHCRCRAAAYAANGSRHEMSPLQKREKTEAPDSVSE